MELEYPPDHWANDSDPSSGLSKYLAMHETLYNKVKNNLILSILPQDMKGLEVLDYGCGCGFFSILCAKRGAMVTGIDASEMAISTAKFYAAKSGVTNRCTFSVSTNVDLQKTSFDVILAKDVIEHIQDDSLWIRTVVNVLKPRGQLVLSTQNAWSLNYLLEGGYYRLWRKEKKWMGWDSTHIRFYTPVILSRIISNHGLMVERWASMYIVPYNILSWLFLLKIKITFKSLSLIDYLVGKVFPFNHFGWGLIVSCRKTGP